MNRTLAGILAATMFFNVVAVSAADLSAAAPAPAPSTDSDEPINLANLVDETQADSYARALLARYEAEDGPLIDMKSRPVVLIKHIGSQFPEQIKWVAISLEKFGYRTDIDWIKPSEFKQTIDQEIAKGTSSLDLLTYNKEIAADPDGKEIIEDAKSETRSLGERAQFAWRRMVGSPNGVTLWIKLKRTGAEKINEAKMATRQSLLALGGCAISLYLGQRAGNHEIHFTRGLATMVSFIWLNMYFARWISEVQGQGRSVEEYEPGKLRVAKNQFVMRSGIFIRSMLVNVIFMMGIFGPEHAFSWKGLTAGAISSGITLFSRFWFEEWQTANMATRMPDGTVIVEPGQHTPQKTTRNRDVFEFFNGIARNVNLIQTPIVKWILPASGVYGLWRTYKKNKYMYARSAQKMLARLRGEKPDYSDCQTLLIHPKANLVAETNQ